MKIFLTPLSFKANIKFCTLEEFEDNKPANFKQEYPSDYNIFFKTQQDYQKIHPDEALWPWNIESIRNETHLVTGKVFTCSAGGVTGANNHSISARYHLVPDKYNIRALKSKISPISLKLDKTVKAIKDIDLSALILGGESTINELKNNSKKLLKLLCIFFKKKNIDASYFWGQNGLKDKRGIDAYYTANDDTWRILKYKLNSNQIVSSIEDLQENFSKMHLGKNDKLYFKDAKTPISSLVFNSRIKFKGTLLDNAA